MNRTMLSDLEQPASLRIIKVPGQFDLAIDTVNKAFLRFAFHTIFSVNAEMLHSHGHASQIPLFTLRIQAQRHGRAGAERREQEFVWGWSGIRPERRGFISPPSMFARRNFLC